MLPNSVYYHHWTLLLLRAYTVYTEAKAGHNNQHILQQGVCLSYRFPEAALIYFRFNQIYPFVSSPTASFQIVSSAKRPKATAKANTCDLFAFVWVCSGTWICICVCGKMCECACVCAVVIYFLLNQVWQRGLSSSSASRCIYGVCVSQRVFIALVQSVFYPAAVKR